MEGTRLQIMALLQQTLDSTVEELARGVGLAQPTVRRHMDILQRDQLVAFRLVRRKPGRPEHVYFLTEQGHEALPKGYVQLLQWLLQALAPGGKDSSVASEPAELEGLFSRIAGTILESHQVNFEEKTPEERREVLEELLQRAQFLPRIEEKSEGLQVQLFNCPFRCIALENAAICALDRQLITQVLGSQVVQEQCIVRGDHHCTYTVAPTP